MNQYKLYDDVNTFYSDLRDALACATESIHMAYYAFDAGPWAESIGQILTEKAATGIPVHLLVDQAGMYLDNWRNGLRNRRLLGRLQRSGVNVQSFRPGGPGRLGLNRLHAKFTAIDNQTLFVGGSNIGEHYLGWRDSNMRITGNLGDGFIQLHELLRQEGQNRATAAWPQLHIGDHPLLFTVPGRQQDIQSALVGLIENARRSVSLRTWYFLPDPKIIAALETQARRGVQVNVLFSHRTRVPAIDLASNWIGQRLSRQGVHVYRYTSGYMHAKEAWNDQGEIIYGSANLDPWALQGNIECCLAIRSAELMDTLNRHFAGDLSHCTEIATNSEFSLPFGSHQRSGMAQA